MRKVLVFAKNYEKYTSGYYHQDIVDALGLNTDMEIYGPGYPHYAKEDSFDDVLYKHQLSESQIDLIVFVTSWDEDGLTDTVDPHPKIDVSLSKCKKVYFNTFNSSNIVRSLFEQILPSGNYYMKDLPKEVRVHRKANQR